MSRNREPMPHATTFSPLTDLRMSRSCLAALETSKFASANQRWHLGRWTFEEIPARTCFHHATGTAYSFVQIWVVAVDLVLALRCSFCHGWRWSAAMAGTLCRRVAEPFRESLGGIGIALPQQRNWHPHRHSISLPENCHWIWGVMNPSYPFIRPSIGALTSFISRARAHLVCVPYLPTTWMQGGGNFPIPWKSRNIEQK